MSAMVSQLFTHFRANLSSIQDILTNILAPAPASAPDPPDLASGPPDNDETFGEENFDLEDFYYILLFFLKYYNIIWSVI